MTTAIDLRSPAAQALEMMRAAGFEHAQVTASRSTLDELNANENTPSLLRSTESFKLQLQGIVEGRSASAEVVGFDIERVRAAVADLFTDAGSAPQDTANAVSAGQSAAIVRGPQEGDREQLADSIAQVLAFRERETPRMMIRQSEAQHHLYGWQTLTTGGSDLSGSLGWYSFLVGGAARDGDKSSSLAYTYGNTDHLASAPVHEQFGVADMMRAAQRQIETKPFDGRFEGDVVLMPHAVESLMGWLLGQLSDMQLISGSSVYRERVGQRIASTLFTLRSRFDASGIAAVSVDGFATPDVTIVQDGTLKTLTPSLYGSRKTGLPHVPVASGGWDIAPGATPLAEMVGGVQRGALVGRLSMGAPAPNGNFSGVIKNSFAIEGGEIGHALSETMITGNMARMLQDIVAVSRETQDGTGVRLPWVRIGGLHFS
ncbi:MAG: metallopeptidase TldD-related protein [Pseudomonadota bacterium]